MNYKELVAKHGNGLMTRVQYEEIAKELEPYCPCNLLVFGLGEDSYLWQNLNINGLTIFLENNKRLHRHLSTSICYYPLVSIFLILILMYLKT